MIEAKIDLRNLTSLVKNTKKNFALEARKTLADVIVNQIVQGKSPVRGERSFEPYTPEYALKKRGSSKATKPVDMLVTGNMLNSLRIREVGDHGLRIYFKDPIAGYHNDPKGDKPRRLLPTEKNEKFNQAITKKIISILKKAVRKSNR